MNTAQTKKYCKSFASAEVKDKGRPSNVLVYSIGEKKFAYFKNSDPEK